MKKQKKILNKFTAVVTAMTMLLTTIASGFATPVYTYAVNNKGGSKSSSNATITKKPTATPTPVLTKEEKSAMESLMTGLSTFRYKVYEWPDSLTVGGLAFSIGENLYTMRNNKSKQKVLWTDEEITNEMKDFYSTTDWTKFQGMQETVEISNYCSAILSDEVKAYEELMDAAAKEKGFYTYKEIFKAIAQARFNENKKEYSYRKSSKKYKIEGKGTDEFDLFHIDGSWIDGGNTPVGGAKSPTATPRPSATATPTPIPGVTSEPLIATPTPMPESGESSSEKKYNNKKRNYTVQESIDIAADAFASILEDAVYPSPYDTNSLISVVEGFEFGGKSNAIKSQYSSSPSKLKNINGFISFEAYCDKKSLAGDSSESEGKEIDYDKIIEAYAKVIAHNKKRGAADKDTYGPYKYSDQKFYSKVFENYKCSGGGTIDYGNLPEDMKEILRQCMQTWDGRVTKERREIIQQGVLLYGVTYSMDARNSPSYESPKYLDCSSFVGQCYWKFGVATQGKAAADWCTPDNSSNFKEISESELIPGDIGQKCWPGNAGGADHVGIYIGTVNGTKYWLHCTGGYTDGVYHAPGKGIKINNYNGFQHFGRYPGL